MKKSTDRSAWIVGGTTLVGTGAGLVLLQTSALFFVAAVLIGIGAGLLIASLLSPGSH